MFGLKTQKDVAKEIDRRRSQSARILERLKKGGYITNVDLQKIGFNYTMRVSELRKEGHKITAEYVKPGVFQYIYGGQVKK